jgi:RimJ/RimL family protein N-acetyltransferase
MELRPHYPVVSARLRLRPLGPDDVDALVSYRGQPDVCRFVPFEPMDEKLIVERLSGVWSRTALDDEGQALTLGVELGQDGQLVGDVMLAWHSREHRSGEIGYVFNPAFTGHGYATEAVGALLHLAFNQLGLHRVTARVDVRNRSSARLATRLGMRQEAHLIENEWFKGGWSDEFDFALLEQEWSTGTDAPTAGGNLQ